MAKADDPVFCSTCGDPVPRERVVRGSTTCTKEHANERKLFLRALKDSSSCRYCGHRKSTPERRAAMQRFARLERTRPDLLWPEEFAKWMEGWLPAFKEKYPHSEIDPAVPIDTTSETFMKPCREHFAKMWAAKDQAAEIATDPQEPVEDEEVIVGGKFEVEAVDVAYAADTPERHWYVYRGASFGKKGELCEIMRTPLKGRAAGMNVTQVRFRDGFMPVVGRGLLRTATAAQIKELDEMGPVESKLAASGDAAEGE